MALKHGILAAVLFWMGGVCVAGSLDDEASSRTCGAVNRGFPEGSLVEVIDASSLAVSVPDNWRIFVQQEGQDWRIDQKATVRCSCEAGRGCSPMYRDGTTACVMSDSCTTCTRGGSKRAIPFLVSESGIVPATQKEIRELPAFEPAMLEIPEIKAAIAEWHQAFGNDSVTGKSRSGERVAVRVYGHIAALEWDRSVDISKHGAVDPMVAIGLSMMGDAIISKAPKITCACEAGGTSCKHESEWGVHWCDASACGTCVMRF